MAGYFVLQRGPSESSQEAECEWNILLMPFGFFEVCAGQERQESGTLPRSTTGNNQPKKCKPDDYDLNRVDQRKGTENWHVSLQSAGQRKGTITPSLLPVWEPVRTAPEQYEEGTEIPEEAGARRQLEGLSGRHVMEFAFDYRSSKMPHGANCKAAL